MRERETSLPQRRQPGAAAGGLVAPYPLCSREQGRVDQAVPRSSTASYGEMAGPGEAARQLPVDKLVAEDARPSDRDRQQAVEQRRADDDASEPRPRTPLQATLRLRRTSCFRVRGVQETPSSGWQAGALRRARCVTQAGNCSLWCGAVALPTMAVACGRCGVTDAPNVSSSHLSAMVFSELSAGPHQERRSMRATCGIRNRMTRRCGCVRRGWPSPIV